MGKNLILHRNSGTMILIIIWD
jgi:hypothetical protein